MAYADYAFYFGQYGGTSISEDAFTALARRASLFIDRLTYSRLHAGWTVTDAVRNSVCAVAEAMQASDKAQTLQTADYAAAVKSENTDGRSVTYQNVSDIREAVESGWAEAAEQYLLFTGLMDRSVGNAHKC